MRNFLLAAASAAVISLASPAFAVENIAVSIDNAAVPGDVVTATGTGSVNISLENLDGITVLGSIGTNSGSELTGANLLVTNTDATQQTLRLAVGGIGYVGPDNEFAQTATIQLASGTADLTGAFYVDALNQQMGLDASSVFGVNNFSFDSGALTGPQSVSENNLAFGPAVDTPFSMGEVLMVTLAPGAQVTVQSIGMTAAEAVPETSTWVMAIMGFGLLGFAVRRRQRQALGIA